MPAQLAGPGVAVIPGPAPLAEPTLLRLLSDHAALHRLCDALEAIADGLPDLTMRAAAVKLCGEVAATHGVHVARESLYMTQAFGGDCAQPLSRQLLRQINDRNTADTLHLQDLTVALAANDVAPETLAYMLRCFFDGCRRAMNFEALALLTLGMSQLSPTGRSMLIASLG